MTQKQDQVKRDSSIFAAVEMTQYQDVEKLQQEYRELVLKEIQKEQA